jgi:AraC-like DNA-binding protein
MENYLRIDSVGTYFKLRNYELLHPLVGILDFNKFEPENTTGPKYSGLTFDCYAIFLKDHKSCKLKYGGQPYDFEEGTMVFMAPNQSVGLTYDKGFVPKGYALLFHPDLLFGTGLSKKINDYNFFSYAVNEALHLSAEERGIILSLLEKIQYELEQNLDKHSKKLIVSNLELLFDYCLRFYDRQFLTREVAHTTVLAKFDALLHDYFDSNQPQESGLPAVSYFAEQMHLSSNYFGDLVKKETGKTAQEHIQLKVIDLAKERIYNAEKSISEIAFELGFKYPQHFSRFFKKKVGFSPKDFRSSIN